MKKYEYSYTNTGNKAVKIEIYDDKFTGDVTYLSYGAKEPIRQRLRGDREKDTIISGQEWEFSIITEDSFDDVFSSQYRDYWAKIWVNGSNVFQGWLKPENLKREYINYKYHITFPFTDGLGDLKEKPFRHDDDSYYEGTTSILYVVREALKKTGVEKDFKIIANTYETSLMTEGQCPLDKVNVDMRRFITMKDGKMQAMNCYDVIESVLKNFHVNLKQEGYYWITDYQEMEWVRANSTFANLVQFGFNDLSVSTASQYYPYFELSGLSFRRGGNYSKQHPLKRVDLNFRNKRVGDPFDSVDSWLDNWTLHNLTLITADHDYIRFRVDSAETEAYLQSAVFSVSKVSDSDYIRFQIEQQLIEIVNLISPHPNISSYVRFMAEVFGPSLDGQSTISWGSEFIGTATYQEYNILTSSNEPPWLVRQSGDYYIRLHIVQNDAFRIEYDGLEIKFNGLPDIRVVTISQGGDETDNITFDTNYVMQQDDGFGAKEVETLFGDGLNKSEVGAFQISDTLTELWRRYGKTSSDDKPIIYHLAQKYLNSRQTYRDIIQFDFKDELNIINLHNVVIINGEGFEIFAINKEYKQGWANIQAKKLYSVDVSTSITETILNSIDGNSTQNYGGTTNVIGLLENDVIDLIRGAWGSFTGAQLTNRQIAIEHDLGYRLVHTSLFYKDGARIADTNFEVLPDSTTQATLTVNLFVADTEILEYRMS